MHSTRAIVLGRRGRGESDLLVSLFTESSGLISATAQGVRKPGAKLKGHLELFAETRVGLVASRAGYRLTHALLEQPFSGLFKQLSRQQAAQGAATILQHIAFEGEDREIWDTLFEYFTFLSSREADQDEALRLLLWFSARLLKILGYQLSEEAAAPAGIGPYESPSIGEVFAGDFAADEIQEVCASIRQAFERHFRCHFRFLAPGFGRARSAQLI